MFEPNLDNGSQWVEVNKFSAPTDLFNYLHYFDINFRCDAIRVKIDIDLSEKDWNNAGEIIQYWQPGNEKYQVKYSKVYLKEETVIRVEPLESSTILFRPVGWLYNWTITTFGREYRPSSSQNLDLDELIQKLDTLSNAIDEKFEASSVQVSELSLELANRTLDVFDRIQDLKLVVFEKHANLLAAIENIECVSMPSTGSSTDFREKGGGKFDPSSPSDNTPFGFYQGLI